jgi:hypothetical protein
MDALVQAIEAYMLQRADWVPASELCARFGLGERQLRQDRGRPGLCSEFAISNSQHGLKHVTCATTREFLEATHGGTKHAVSELRRVRRLRERRHSMVRQIRRPAVCQERDTPQLCFADLLSGLACAGNRGQVGGLSSLLPNAVERGEHPCGPPPATTWAGRTEG